MFTKLLLRGPTSISGQSGTVPGSIPFSGAGLRVVAAGAMVLATAASSSAQQLRWLSQFGSSQSDTAIAAATGNDGSLYATGVANDFVAGLTVRRGAFVTKFGRTGTLGWLRQVDFWPSQSVGTGVCIDLAGNVLVCGNVIAPAPGSHSYATQGDVNVFVAKYSADGVLLWTRQIGTAEDEVASGIACDSAGNIVICGYTRGGLGGQALGSSDAFLTKLDADGTVIWTRQFGGGGPDFAKSVAVGPAGEIIVGGIIANPSTGDTPPPYLFVSKFSATGTEDWRLSFGTAADDVRGVGIDAAGNTQVAGGFGVYDGSGTSDAFLAKFNPAGGTLWTQRFSTPGAEVAAGLSVDIAGNAYVVGSTTGDLGAVNHGGRDTFVVATNPDGSVRWIRQEGTAADDIAQGVAVDVQSNVFVVGQTEGSLGGASAGMGDAFIGMYSLPCAAPAVPVQPINSTVCRSATAVLVVDATGGGTLSYRWRKGGIPVDAAVNPSAATPTLRLTRVQPADAGLYDCVVSSDCGTATSTAARLTVRTCICLEADIAGGGNAGNEPDGTVDGTDFIAFINSFAIGDAAVDPLADIAGGGDTGLEPDGTIDGTDFIFFINAFAIGC